MNPEVKSAVLSLAARTGVLSLKRSLRRGLRVVTYHGVDELQDPVVNADRLQTDPGVFRRQLAALARVFRFVPLADAVRQFRETGTWPENGLAITFDDGYRNNLEAAAPILMEMGVAATFFVTAGFIEGRCSPWWYDLRQMLAGDGRKPHHAAARAVELEARLRPLGEEAREKELDRLGVKRGEESVYPFMTADECRKLAALGFDVQCHGDTHVSFAAESTEVLEREVGRSVEFIENLGVKPWALAYPYGHAPRDPASVQAIMTSRGLVAALTTCEGVNGRGADAWSLRRWDMHGGYSPLAALARVS